MSNLVFAACFLALAALSGLAAAGGRRWAFRLPLIAATPLLALAVWWQLAQRDGWPSGSRPADGSAFVASVVRAPTPGTAGTIFLWAQPPNSDTPRAYRLPYSSDLEQRLGQAAGAARRGARFAVRTTRSNGHNGSRGRQVQAGTLQLYRLPVSEPETKDHSA